MSPFVILQTEKKSFKSKMTLYFFKAHLLNELPSF